MWVAVDSDGRAVTRLAERANAVTRFLHSTTVSANTAWYIPVLALLFLPYEETPLSLAVSHDTIVFNLDTIASHQARIGLAAN
jgi:hypothetical protein